MNAVRTERKLHNETEMKMMYNNVGTVFMLSAE